MLLAEFAMPDKVFAKRVAPQAIAPMQVGDYAVSLQTCSSERTFNVSLIARSKRNRRITDENNSLHRP